MSRSRFTPFFAPVLALPLLALAACNAPDSGTGDAQSASTGGSVLTTTTSGGTSETGSNASTPAVGESCVSNDPNHLCLAIHFVSYTNSGTPTATQAQVATIIHEMNTLWAQCNIGFQVQKYEQVDPAAYGLAYGADSQAQTEQIRSTFGAPNDELLAVTTGPWGTAVNAWTNMPGEGTYGAVMEQSIVTYGSGIIYAHEFGHYLGLDHVSDTSNLMDAIIYTNSNTITSSQCATARQSAQSYWSAMLRV